MFQTPIKESVVLLNYTAQVNAFSQLANPETPVTVNSDTNINLFANRAYVPVTSFPKLMTNRGPPSL